MTRLAFALLIGCVGCAHIQPIGPLADNFGGRPPQDRPEPDPEPIIQQTPRPTVPAVYVTPGEVTAATAAEAAKRLQQELETDRRATAGQ